MKNLLIKGLFSIKVLLLIFAIVVPQRLQAQVYEVGGGLGVSGYTGDIIRIGDPQQLGSQLTVHVRRNFDNVWSLRGGMSFAGLKGSDAVRPIDNAHFQRGASFKGTALEAAVVMEYHFLDYLRKYSGIRYSPYAFFGLGFLKFVGRGDSYIDESPAYRDINVNSLLLPFGMGIKYKLNDQWILALEAGYRATLTDGIDKIEGDNRDINKTKISSAPTGLPAGYNLHRGNIYDKDGYYFLGLTLNYTFRSIKCLVY